MKRDTVEGAFGFSAEYMRFPDADVSVVALSNRAGLDARQLAERAAEIALKGKLAAEARAPETGIDLARFGRMFGELEINVANQFHEPGFPEVMVLSNMTENGKPIGLGDAGQGWHTDMSYSKEIALANVLYAIKVPARDGRPRGPGD